jgi:transcriptional regulator with PAS, ATPase and Fis domain
MKILISWLAYHEDFKTKENSVGLEANTNGPNSAFHRNFFSHEKHILLHSGASTETRAEYLVNSLRLEHKDRQIEVVNMGIDDPINVKEIMTKVTGLLAEHKDDEVEAYISPGTPAMQVVWYLLYLNKTFDLKIFQTREAKFTTNKKPELIGINLDRSSAPITALIYENEIAKNSESKYEITSTKEVVYREARLVAQTPSVTVLIYGESGTGKENLANYIHESSGRAAYKLVPINCSALGDQLLESRLFGYKKGAFTGAEKDTIGLFEQANKGTIFLDEIGDISPYMQQSLLRVLQEKKVTPIGGGKQIEIDVRVIAATNRNLVDMCKEGKFRWDLFYRLAVVDLHLPALRNYPAKEVKQLINSFLKSIAVDLKKDNILKPDKEAMEAMVEYAYPGNIREMQNIISRLYVFKEGEIGVKDLPSFMFGHSRLKSWKLEELEKQHITTALNTFEGNQRQTAKALGITVNTLKAKIVKYKS